MARTDVPARLRACGAGIGLLLLLSLLIYSLLWVGTDRSFYRREQTRLNIGGELSMAQPELEQLNKEITDFLKAYRSDFDIHGSIDGKPEGPLFTPLEQSHMLDVQLLFRAGYAVAGALIAGAFVFGVVLVLSNGRRGALALAGGYRLALLALLALFGLAALYAVIDFSAAFDLFHRVLFANEDWLLPAQATLIRMMPLDFFIAAGLQVALRTLLMWLAALALSLAASLSLRKKGS